MTSVTTLPQSRPLTRADLETMPDDGHRYELLDGALIVTPAPGNRHQGAVGKLFLALTQACPEHLAVRLAPFDVTLADDTVVQPDLLVAARTALTERGLQSAPLLAVEVQSPSTRLIDRELKRARYEEAGCASYWVFDPTSEELVVWQLRDGRYVEVLRLQGTDPGTVTEPYALELQPRALID